MTKYKDIINIILLSLINFEQIIDYWNSRLSLEGIWSYHLSVIICGTRRYAAPQTLSA